MSFIFLKLTNKEELGKDRKKRHFLISYIQCEYRTECDSELRAHNRDPHSVIQSYLTIINAVLRGCRL